MVTIPMQKVKSNNKPKMFLTPGITVETTPGTIGTFKVKTKDMNYGKMQTDYSLLQRDYISIIIYACESVNT